MPFTNGHALIVGVGNYQHEPDLNVPITAADAQAVAEALRDPQSCGYPEAQVTLLTNAAATRDGILAALTDLAARAKPDDTVLLFYSGHGAYSADGAYQLTTHDTRLAQDKVVAGTAISQPELLDRLRAIPARRLILLINACHAGELSPVLGDSGQPFTGQPLPQQAADAVLATGSGRIIITACRENQVAYIGPGPLTIFAQALTDGLRGRGLSGRAGYISAFDLYTHLYFAVGEAVEKRVPAALRQRYGDTQEPELTVLKGVGPFAVALYRGSTMLGDFPTDHRPPDDTALREVSPARSQWALQQSISGAGAVGIGGSTSNSPITTGSNNTVIQSGRDTIQAGGDVTQVGGNKITGDISVGDVSGTGIAIGHKAQAHVRQGMAGTDLAQLFSPIYQQIESRQSSDAIKSVLTDHVQKIEAEVQKGDQADAKRIEGWLEVIASMAPDILEVVTSTLTSPIAGIATIVKKIAEKARMQS